MVVSRAQAWLKAPLVDPAGIRQRLDLVEAMIVDQGLREGVREALRGVQWRRRAIAYTLPAIFASAPLKNKPANVYTAW